MAALRHGITTVIIPEDNLRDLEEIDQTVRSQLHFVPARHMDTVLETALVSTYDPAAAILPEMPPEAVRKEHRSLIRQ